VDLAQLRPAAAPRPDRPFTFAFLGRLTEEKGVPVLLRAVAGLPAGVQLRIAGDGPLRDLVEKAAAAAPERLHYLGHCADVRSLYHAVDAVVMPSLSEGLPMTALEAMACGLPLVASRVGGLPEVVQPDETGLLVAPDNGDELAGAMARLSEDPDTAAAMGASGRKRVEREFDQERMLERLEETYRSVLES
jgi:glycosyltransferase involved in cell wall biosynthesis